MSFKRTLNVYTKFIEKLHSNRQPFYELFYENTPWNLTFDHEFLFQQLKTILITDKELKIHHKKHSIFIKVDAFPID